MEIGGGYGGKQLKRTLVTQELQLGDSKSPSPEMEERALDSNNLTYSSLFSITFNCKYLIKRLKNHQYSNTATALYIILSFHYTSVI